MAVKLADTASLGSTYWNEPHVGQEGFGFEIPNL